MRKTYQNEETDTSQPAVPDAVSVSLAGLAGELREGLMALAVGAGLQVMAAIMESDVTARCGPRGRHDPERAAVRHGHERGSVSLGGRRVPYPHWISLPAQEVAPASMPCRHRARRRFQASFRRMNHCIFWILGFRQSS